MDSIIPKLTIEDLTVQYVAREQTTLAVEHVSLTVADGEFVSIVGPSGCGKSTLLKAVCGLLQPTQGTVMLDGKLVHGVPDSVGFVFQNDALLPWKTIADNVKLPLEIRGFSQKEQTSEALRLLNTVGLKGLRTIIPSNFQAVCKNEWLWHVPLATIPSCI